VWIAGVGPTFYLGALVWGQEEDFWEGDFAAGGIVEG
jgi:hypothetical protein